MKNKQQGDTLQTTEAVGLTETAKDVEEFKSAWLSHLDDFSRLGWKMRSSEELQKLKDASEKMAEVIGIATSNYEQGIAKKRGAN